MSWFRLHTALLHNVKVQQLPATAFKALINLWCLAKEGNGIVPPVAQIAFQLRCGVNQAERLMNEFVDDYNLFDRNKDGTFHPHEWEFHQFKSDVSTDRVNSFRERKRNVSRNGNETPSEYRVQSTEAEAEQKQKEPLLVPAKVVVEALRIATPKNGSARGSRFYLSELPAEWLEWSSRELRWDAFRSEKVFLVFSDYWRAKPGAAGRKSDWLGTWRNWCRKDDEKPAPGLFQAAAQRETATERSIRVGLERVQRTGRL